MRKSRNARNEATQPKIALFGAFGVGNLGNECTLQALLYNIRKYVPDAEISCICSGPDEARSAYNIPASLIKDIPLSPIRSPILRSLRRIFVAIPIELIRWFKAIAKLRNVNMLIMTGTGMLGGLSIAPLGLHYEILKWAVVARLCQCKVLFLSVGAGSIQHPLSRRFVKAALSCADYRSYRDHFSKDYLKRIGFESECDYVYPDLAYSYPTAMIPRAHPDGASHGTVVGVGLLTSVLQKDQTVYRDYIVKLGNFVCWLLERKYTVRLLIGDVAYDQRARHDLRAFIEESGITYESGRIIDEPATSVDDILSQLAGTDLVVASRLHNVLLALMLGKPVLAISYHEKVDALMAETGLSQFCQGIESIDLEKMIHQFATLEEQSDCLKQQLQRKADACREALDEQYDRVLREPLGFDRRGAWSRKPANT